MCSVHDSKLNILKRCRERETTEREKSRRNQSILFAICLNREEQNKRNEHSPIYSADQVHLLFNFKRIWAHQYYLCEPNHSRQLGCVLRSKSFAVQTAFALDFMDDVVSCAYVTQ